MSYPGRPPMVPGMAVPPPGMNPLPYMGMGGPPPMMMPPHLIPPPMPPNAPSNSVIRASFRPNMNNQAPRPLMSKRVAEPSSLQAVTVFVGNITERAPDAMIRHILSACGTVNSWKRVQGTSGRAPAFGFCEYASPDSGLRAVRLLHDFEIGGKKLVVKVDTKTKEVLDEFKNEKRQKLGRSNSGSSPLQDEAPTAADEESNDYMDDEMKAVDSSALSRISNIMNDYNKDIENYTPPMKRSGNKDKNSTKPQENFLKLAQGSMQQGIDGTPDFDDGEMEEGKRDLITREIGKFREIMKKQEEEKELERRRREARDKERRDRDGGPKSPYHRRDRASPSSPPRNSRSPPPLPSRSRRTSASPPPPPRSRPQPPSRSPSPEGSFSNKLRAKARSEREWRRSRSRSRERDRERETDVKRSEKQIQRDRELEEEAKEKKKSERKAREKEAAYQERLRNWENREKRKAKEHSKEKDKERKQSEEMSKEGRRLKEFLEDYDDERDDPKFYKGRELGRRLALREQEIEADARDRAKERDELEEIKAQIFSDKECTNPLAEFEKIKQNHDALYQPKILVKVESKQASQVRPGNSPSLENEGSLSSMPSKNASPWKPPQDDISTSAMMSPPQPATFHQQNLAEQEDSQLSAVSQTSMEMDVSSPVGGGDSSSRGFSNWNKSPSNREIGAKVSSPGHSNAAPPNKRKKLEIKEVFNTEDDDDSSLGAGASRKRKPLVPLDYGEEKVLKKKDAEASNSKVSQEEKRKHIKSLIDKIPTDKEALFAFPIDWGAVDSNLMEKRIRPWINKKIIDYIGEPEPALVDFICSKVILGSDPKGILDDVQMVLDEEAEVFVVKMWRLLIYEIESKKLGLVK
ncbi:RNA-binding protein 25 [Cloeon dipterum]|uniref:RNA-binding protein 25 n=1 Tax=Cloeon dipterum TaxID=197152 RepID=UPI00321FECB5